MMCITITLHGWDEKNLKRVRQMLSAFDDMDSVSYFIEEEGFI